jgi:hypothetical protein
MTYVKHANDRDTIAAHDSMWLFPLRQSGLGPIGLLRRALADLDIVVLTPRIWQFPCGDRLNLKSLSMGHCVRRAMRRSLGIKLARRRPAAFGGLDVDEMSVVTLQSLCTDDHFGPDELGILRGIWAEASPVAQRLHKQRRLDSPFCAFCMEMNVQVVEDALHRFWACPGHASERNRAMSVWEGDWSMLPLTFRVTGLPTMLTLTAFGPRAFECILAWQRFLLAVANKTWVPAVRRAPLLPPWRAVVIGDVAQYSAFGVDSSLVCDAFVGMEWTLAGRTSWLELGFDGACMARAGSSHLAALCCIGGYQPSSGCNYHGTCVQLVG